jgi:hypothetical protein
VIYIVFGVVLLLLETLRWVGVLKDGPQLLPAWFSLSMPAVFVLMGFWKVKPIERWAIVVFGVTMFVNLNRNILGLRGLAAPIVYAGAAYLIIFGRTHGSHLAERPKIAWAILALVVTIAAVMLVVFAP